MVRLLGCAEVAAGIGALVVGGPAAWAVALLYLAFAVVVSRAVLAGAESCGCFGRLDAPPSLIHVAANLVMAAVSFAAVGADAPIPTIMQAADDSLAFGLTLAVEVVVLTGLALVTFTALPEALGVRAARRDGRDARGAMELFHPVSSPQAGSPRTRGSVPAGPESSL